MQAQPVESTRLPDRERFASPRHVPFYDRFSGRIIIGLFCSSIVFVLFNFGGVKTAVRYAASAVIHVGGDPLTEKGGVIDKLEQKIEKVKTPPFPIAPAGLVPLPGFGHKSPEQLKLEAEQKEAERQRREQSEIKAWHARARAVKLVIDPDTPLEELRVKVPIAEHQAAEEAKKKSYYERADRIGLKADPTLDYKTFKQQVEEAEKELAADADYQARLREWERDMEKYEYAITHGANARCTNPRCRFAMRVSTHKGEGQCRRCLTIFPRTQALALYDAPSPPKKPTPPKKNPGLLWRIFH